MQEKLILIAYTQRIPNRKFIMFGNLMRREVILKIINAYNFLR